MKTYDDNRLGKKVLWWTIQLAEKGVRNWDWNIKKLMITAIRYIHTT